MHREIFCIDPAFNSPERGSYELLCKLSKFPISYHLPALEGMQSLLIRQKKVPIAAIIVLGSYASVHDYYIWQEELRAWLKAQIYKSIPCLGICYAHQLIAKIFAGEVSYLEKDKSKYKGVRKVFVVKDSSLEGVTSDGVLAYAHREYVSKCPLGMKPLLFCKDLDYEALYHIRFPIWTFQGHLEASEFFCNQQGISKRDFSKISTFGIDIIKNFFTNMVPS
jgi:GMP synthase-like glutamine amidotransferase